MPAHAVSKDSFPLLGALKKRIIPWASPMWTGAKSLRKHREAPVLLLPVVSLAPIVVRE